MWAQFRNILATAFIFSYSTNISKLLTIKTPLLRCIISMNENVNSRDCLNRGQALAFALFLSYTNKNKKGVVSVIY